MVVLLLFTVPPKVIRLAVARLVFCCKTYSVEGDGHEMTTPLSVLSRRRQKF
jgi:hypothetical protein